MMKCFSSLALVSLLGIPLKAQDAKPPKQVPISAVNAAITRGTEWLIASQHPNGSWDYDNGPLAGNNALAVYTLLKSGVPAHHEAIRLGFDELRRHPPGSTYGTALLLMALAAHHDDADLEWAQTTTKRLLDIQSGDFGYVGRPGPGDLSNTQYGALGMRAARQMGIPIPDAAWRALAEATLKHTQSGYGFSYRDGAGAGSQPPTGSMTSAGAAILNICIDALEGSNTKQKTLDRYASARDQGLEWLGEHFSVDRNFGGSWLGYYLYGLERVGSLCDVTRLGHHDWYNEGAAKLVREQQPIGSWQMGNSGPVTETCYALLFLRRATRAVVVSGADQPGKASFASTDPKAPVALVATVDSHLNMWLGNWTKSALKRLEWPGEEGKGPRIVRVTYFLDKAVAASIEGSDTEPAGATRFPAKIELETGGTHHLKVQVEVAPPPHEIQGVLLRGANELVTAQLEFQAPNLPDPADLEAVRDAARNLLPKSLAQAKASSVAPLASLQDELGLEPGFPIGSGAVLAADGRGMTAWIAAPDDASPALTLTFKKPQLVNRILIGNAHVFERVQAKLGRVATATILVNNRFEYKLSMPPDEKAKARLKLPKSVKLRKLEIRITARVPGEDGYRAVGLSEVELQLVE